MYDIQGYLMKIIKTEPGKNLIPAVLLFLILIGTLPSFAEDNISGCSRIDDDKERLKCYDEVAGRKLLRPESKNEETAKQPEEILEHNSYLSKLWELDKDKRRSLYTIMPHRSTYMLPFSYNSLPNEEPFRQASHNEDILNTEVKFQISMKVKLWQDVLGRDLDLWFGYTQQSFWQFYNFSDSSPFRDTDYEPELLLNFRTNYDLLGMQGRMVNIGFAHQSNGQSKPLSRSWNRIVGNAGFEKGNFVLLLKTWYRIPESKEQDDNPGIYKYMGYGEVWGYYFWKKNRFGVMLRDNLRFNDNRGAVQLEWSFPMLKNVDGYIQYFSGYGESLLDYNHAVNRIGLGFILTDWD
jgi:phospholipase A1/A2